MLKTEIKNINGINFVDKRGINKLKVNNRTVQIKMGLMR